ncbi:MAG: hypothetical protein AB8G05_14915 [Oligoflexales bacterium]
MIQEKKTIKTFVFLYLILSLLTQENAKAVEIPINIGLGPAYYLIPEKLEKEQTSHIGLSIHIKAVIDKTSIENAQKQNTEEIP